MRCSGGWMWRLGGLTLLVWLIGVAFFSPSYAPPTYDAHLAHRLEAAVQELDSLKAQNEEIRSVLDQFTQNGLRELHPWSGNDNKQLVADLQTKLEHARDMLQSADATRVRETGSVGCEFTPSLDFELTRRQAGKSIQETWWYLADQLKQLRKKVEAMTDVVEDIDRVLDEGSDHIRVSQFDLNRFSQLDGLASWRERESQSLSKLVQDRLFALQNPADCSTARKLVCNLNKGCGYGCQVHHAIYCFVVAYGTRRTLILKSKGWRYNKGGWEEIFKSPSDTCTDSSGRSHSHWPASNETQVVDLPIIDTISIRPPFLPLAIPADLSLRLIRLHGDPSAWWIGQFLKFLLKPQAQTQQFLDDMAKSYQFERPIVGLHIRRTDKVGTEAAFHSLAEYMSHAEEFYAKIKLTQPNVVKRVFLASDDPSVIVEAKEKYKDYVIIGDANIAQSASVNTRYSDSSLKGVIADIHFLSLTDYLVCTFSSQVCRIAYEMMQMHHPDASSYFRSLDDIYYYGGQNAHDQKARFAHTPKRREEIILKPGDVVGIAGNHWDGYSKGMNRRTHQNGLYPSYKAEEVVDVVPMASYDDVDKLNGN